MGKVATETNEIITKKKKRGGGNRVTCEQNSVERRAKGSRRMKK